MGRYYSDEEDRLAQAALKELRDREEEQAIDLDRDFLDPDTFTTARLEIEELPAGVQEEWMRKLVQAQEEQAEEAAYSEPVSGGSLTEDARVAFHEELKGATTQEETRAVLSKFGQIEE